MENYYFEGFTYWYERYNELTRSVVGISPKVLTENLRDLEQDGIINRKVYPVVPPKVEYSLTDKGWELKGVLDAMREFGMKYRSEADESR